MFELIMLLCIILPLSLFISGRQILILYRAKPSSETASAPRNTEQFIEEQSAQTPLIPKSSALSKVEPHVMYVPHILLEQPDSTLHSLVAQHPEPIYALRIQSQWILFIASDQLSIHQHLPLIAYPDLISTLNLQPLETDSALHFHHPQNDILLAKLQVENEQLLRIDYAPMQTSEALNEILLHPDQHAYPHKTYISLKGKPTNQLQTLAHMHTQPPTRRIEEMKDTALPIHSDTTL